MTKTVFTLVCETKTHGKPYFTFVRVFRSRLKAENRALTYNNQYSPSFISREKMVWSEITDLEDRSYNEKKWQWSTKMFIFTVYEQVFDL